VALRASHRGVLPHTMPTLELKPMGSTKQQGSPVSFGEMLNSNICRVPSIDEIVFTARRSPVPPQLIGKVDEALWEETYDLVKMRLARKLELKQEAFATMSKMMPSNPCCLCPCCLCCKMCCGGGMNNLAAAQMKQQQDAQEERQAWLALVQSEQIKYSPCGIHVTLSDEMHISGGGKHRVRQTLVTVGLKFETAEAGGVQAAYSSTAVVQAVEAVPMAQMMERGAAEEESAIDKITKLAKLKDSGVLTEEEFAAKKEQLLREV
jgi:hypothetical protein